MYGETTLQEVFEDFSKAENSFIRYHEEFKPDMAYGTNAFFPTKSLDLLDCQFIRWPGKHLRDKNAGFQIVDREDGYMSPDEYLEYAEDPTGFMMRKLLPRHYKALEGLSALDFSNPIYYNSLLCMIPAAFPPVQNAFQAISGAGKEMLKACEDVGHLNQRLAEMGLPNMREAGANVPFDIFNDTLRGLVNTTMDMLDCPDELLAALETSTKIQVRSIKYAFATNPDITTCSFFVHNGTDMFMSREQFQTFYWPGFKTCIDTVIECGGIAQIYLEDKYDNKLDILANELPAGKCIVNLINTDLEKAKNLFAGKICVEGGVDGVLLQHGSKEEVIKNVKHAIDILAPGGGYFLDTDVSLDVVKPENLHALFETARTYMKY